jgi:hypothetical protein
VSSRKNSLSPKLYSCWALTAPNNKYNALHGILWCKVGEEMGRLRSHNLMWIFFILELHVSHTCIQVGQYLQNEYPTYVSCHMEPFAKFCNFFGLLLLFIGNLYMSTQIYMYVYIYIYIWVCVIPDPLDYRNILWRGFSDISGLLRMHYF